MQTIKRIRVEHPQQVVFRMLTEARATLLGSGGFASAYRVGNRAIKIGSLHKNTAYLAYVRQVFKDPENPLFPKIYNATIYMSPDGDRAQSVIYVEMELLDNADSREDRFNYYEEMRSLRRMITAPDKHPEQLLDTTLSNTIKAVRRAFVNARRLDDSTVFDMHLGNFMLRGNQIVITDPIA